MNLVASFLRRVVVLLCVLSVSGSAQQLEIHVINVGWGASLLVKGPDGTTVLLDAGNTGKGTNEVVPYLQSIGIQPANGLDYTIVSHQHCDHNGGMDEVVNAGYNIRIKNYYNGSTYTSSCVDGWNAAASTTTAGAPVAMPVGTQILLGNGAKLTCVARNGSIIGGGTVSVSDENDRSLACLIQYGGFDFLWAGDMGGGSDGCTGRSTSQTNVETAVIQAISPGGASPMISSGGIDVLYVNHHGSESSTNPDWMNLSRPAAAVISVGAGQTSGWDLPRIDVVEHVLLAQSTACITVPATDVYQTEEGSPSGSLTSFAGYCVGNIKITTDGINTFTVSGDGQVNQGPNEVVAAGLPKTYNLDDASGPPDTTPPVVSGETATTITANSAVITWNTNEASNSVVEYGLTTTYGSTASDATNVTNHSVQLSGLSANTVYHYRVKSTDAAGNTAVSSDHTFQTGGSFNYAPSSVTIVQGTLNSGTVSNLATNNGSYYVVNSTTSGTRTTDWYGSVTVSQTPSTITKLTVTYDGKYSRSVTQSLYLYNWSSSSWTKIDSRTVGTTDVTITNSQTSPSNYVSSSGVIRLRVQGTIGISKTFTCSGDYLQFTVETSGSNLSKQIVQNTADNVPPSFHLYQNFPNPFNPTTKIRFDLAKDAMVNLRVFDVVGREVATLVNGERKAGIHDVLFDGTYLASGLYYYRLSVTLLDNSAESFVETRKLMLVK
jgi:beta-lactamase superfamily II metal-dependent hydrolase